MSLDLFLLQDNSQKDLDGLPELQVLGTQFKNGLKSALICEIKGRKIYLENFVRT
jgi:hypothetical protein